MWEKLHVATIVGQILLQRSRGEHTLSCALFRVVRRASCAERGNTGDDPPIATANQLLQVVLTYPMGLIADLFSDRAVLAIGL